MKKLILIAFVCSALYTSAAGYFGIKPIVNEPNCYGVNTGSISLSLVGGVSPYHYSWSNGSTTAILSNLAAGSYTVTVVDAHSVTATYTIVMAEPFQLNASTTTANASHHGSNDGYINLTVDGGTPSYSYDWSNGATSENLTGLAAGTYTVTVTDAEGCTTTTSKTITQPAAPHFIGMPEPQGQIRSLGASDNSNGSSQVSTNGAPKLNSEDVLVYPNPASNAFTLKTGEVTNAQISLIDINGQTMSQQKASSNETNVNVSNMPKGNYIVEIKTESGTVNKTVTVK